MGDEGPGTNAELEWLLGREDVAASSSNPGVEYLCRPGQILVVQDDLDDDLIGRLEEWGAWTDDESPVLGEIGVLRYRLPRDVDVGTVVSSVRNRPDGRVPRVGPHHILIGEPPYHGGPGHSVSPGEPLEDTPTTKAERKVTVGVLDTGVRTQHKWLNRYDVTAVRPEYDEDQPRRLDADTNSALDRQAGHGTFIAGVVLQQAPTASIRVCSVLDSDGVGDEETIVAGLLEIGEVDILNLSLGGYTHDDMPPVGLERFFAGLSEQRKGTVVVAAAGNNAQTRQFWPAAFSRVIAVAALQEDSSGPAPFTNFGSWVDACAPGVNVKSTFVDWSGLVTTLGDQQTFEFDDWAVWGGTSFAAPKVAGTIAARVATKGIDPAQAAFDCVGAAGLPFLPDLGVVVELAIP
jgi:subtilisin family serine protease